VNKKDQNDKRGTIPLGTGLFLSHSFRNKKFLSMLKIRNKRFFLALNEPLCSYFLQKFVPSDAKRATPNRSNHPLLGRFPKQKWEQCTKIKVN